MLDNILTKHGCLYNAVYYRYYNMFIFFVHFFHAYSIDVSIQLYQPALRQAALRSPNDGL